MDNKKVNKRVNILFVYIVMFVFVAGFVRTVFFPKDINYYENRYSNKIIAPAKKTVFDNTFQNSIEDALSDQIFGAERLKKFYNKMTTSFSDFLINPMVEKNDKNYINYRNGLKIFDGYYVYNTYFLENEKDSLRAKADNYNAILKEHPDIDFYAYFIEKDTDINFESGDKLNADDYVFSLLEIEDSKKRTFEINNFNEFSEYFYKTDHHWKHTGSYMAYTDLVDFLGCEGSLVEKGNEVLVSKEYMGSKAAAAGSNIITESFCAYEYEFSTFKSIIGSQEGNYGEQEKLTSSGPVDSISYGGFYGGDDGEIIFDTGNVDCDNILIIGESYDNAILKLLATHFNRTHSIDLRNYEHYKGSKFNFKQYVVENDIDKVLFIGSVDFYCMKDFELER